MKRLTTLSMTALAVSAAAAPGAGAQGTKQPSQRPNFLFAIADDATFQHWGVMGCDWVSTPAFDRVAGEGILYTGCYTPNAKSAPSRACLLTGRYSWQLKEAGNHICNFPEEFKVFTEVLMEQGYDVAYTCKGWGPGNPGTTPDGGKRQLTGREYSERRAVKPTPQINPIDYAANFVDFLDEHEGDGPWFFWYGPREPHRAYEYGSGIAKGGKTLDMIDEVPPFWPDCDTVRTDLLDYAYEIEHFDDHLGRMLAELERRGELHNTIVIVTADNGMPFPRSKGNDYEYSLHLPLAVMWQDGLKSPGRREEGLVNFVDFAPTIMDLAGVAEADRGMDIEGHSFASNITRASRRCFPRSTQYGRERHDNGRPGEQGYPIRALRSGRYLLVWNIKPHLWPAGNPETDYRDIDASPTKSVILHMAESAQDSTCWRLSMGMRPEVELYDVKNDPYCVTNIASERPRKVASMMRRLRRLLVKQGDPRMGDDGDIFDRYPYYKSSFEGLWDKTMAERAGKIF